MIKLSEITRVGFGGYRISSQSSAQRDALAEALRAGCNLIDTASNYSNGESEALIGSIVTTSMRPNVFLVTKAGYVSEDDLAFFESRAGAAAAAELVPISNDSRHCINPDFLQYRIMKSLRCLACDYLDGILLHNPEYYFSSSGANVVEFERRIKRAFTLLEEMIERKLIRYYGVSSNVLPLNLEMNVTLERLIVCAKAVSSASHFRLIQFPFNLAEWSAAMRCSDQPSLLARARAASMITFANRPLNAMRNGKFMRLAGTRGSEVWPDVRELFKPLFAALDRQLMLLGIEGKIEDLAEVSTLKSLLVVQADAEVADRLLIHSIHTILNSIFSDGVPNAIMSLVSELRRDVNDLVKANMSAKARAFLLEAEIGARVGALGERPYHVAACEALLRAGVDHVLIGMRRTSYVRDFKHLFAKPPD